MRSRLAMLPLSGCARGAEYMPWIYGWRSSISSASMGSSGYPLEDKRREDDEDEGDGRGKWRVTQTDLSERRIS